MSTWIPILTGFLAFVGAIVGNFVAFDLNAAAKRREVRRAQIERFAELISEDQTYLSEYRTEVLFREGTFAPRNAPYDKAYAIYVLYFMDELATPMKTLILARHEYEKEIDTGYMARLSLAQANRQALSVTSSPKANLNTVLEKHSPYHKAMLDCLVTASRIVQETIPEKSRIGRWCADRWTQIKCRFVRRK